MDAAAINAAGSSPDAALHCALTDGVCPKECIGLDALPYDRSEECLGSFGVLVGCIEPPYHSDPRCLVNVESGSVYRVPLAFLEAYDDMGLGDDWTIGTRFS